MEKWTIIILGITGDLSKRKVLPALYSLLRSGLDLGVIIGTGREDTTPQALFEQTLPFIDNPTSDYNQEFLTRLIYQQLDFNHPADYNVLHTLITHQEQSRNLPGCRIAYLATWAQFYCTITGNLVAASIINPHNDKQRVVYEKPFGEDLASAQEINACIRTHLSEKQVYRIDHYLAKELVNNLLLLRYANTLFKAIWSTEHIEQVRILFDEKGGIEDRGAFYDQYGALKDIVQNHLFQLLALVAMEEPRTLNAEDIRDEKAKVLNAVSIVDGVLGQYEGYKNERGVARDSTTETYASLKVMINTPRWEGVPFYLETGKKLYRKATIIEIILNPVAQCLWSPDDIIGNHCAPNVITIHITPEEGFSLHVNAKKPRSLHKIVPVDFSFSYHAYFGPLSSEAYELLLTEIMRGDQSMVVRFDEVEQQWRLIKDIEMMNLPLKIYRQGSTGPHSTSTYTGE